MGTVFQIQTNFSKDEESRIDQAIEIVQAIDQSLSTYKPDSVVSQLNQGKDWVELDEHAQNILLVSKRMYDWTDQRFNPLVYPLVELWGFHQKHSGVDQPPSKNLIQQKRTDLQWNILWKQENKAKFEKPSMKIDFGGIAKGYALDQAVKVLATEVSPTQCGILNLGRQVQTFGPCFEKGVSLPLVHPKNPQKTVGTLTFSGAVATSGNYERSFVHEGLTYSHIIDPKTGYPARLGVLSATVYTEFGYQADVLSTLMFILGPEQGRTWIEKKKAHHFGVIWVMEDLHIEQVKHGSGHFQENPA